MKSVGEIELKSLHHVSYPDRSHDMHINLHYLTDVFKCTIASDIDALHTTADKP